MKKSLKTINWRKIASLLETQLGMLYEEYQSSKKTGDISLKIQEYVESHSE